MSSDPGAVSVAQLLRAARESQGRSLRKVASEMGVDAGYLSRVEHGERAPSAELRQRFSDYFGLDEDDLAFADGRAPDDIVTILRNNRDIVDELRRRHGQHSE